MLSAYGFMDQSSCGSSSQEMSCSSATSEASDESCTADLEHIFMGLEGVFANSDSVLGSCGTNSFYHSQDANFSYANQSFHQPIAATGRTNYDIPIDNFDSVSPQFAEEPYSSYGGWQDSNNLSEVVNNNQSCDFYKTTLHKTFNIDQHNSSTLTNSLCSQMPFSPETGSKPKRRRKQNPKQRKEANIRERTRMFNLNHAYDDLKKRVPTFSYEKRISRMETLRLAVTYIEFMTNLLDGETSPEASQPKCKRRRLIDFNDLSSFSFGSLSESGNHVPT